MSDLTTPAPADALPVVEQPVVETAAAPDAVATPAPSDAAQETEDKAPPRDPNGSGRFIKRTEQLQSQISTLRAEKGSVEREVETLRKTAAKLREELAKPSSVDPNDFAAADTHRVTSAIRSARLEETQQNLEDAESRAAEIRLATFTAKIDGARERMPDLDRDLATFSTLPISPVAAEIIADSDKAPELTVWLARNPQEAIRISRLPAHRQGVEIARIEARVSAPSPKRISTAPAPLQTASGGATSAVLDPEKMSQAEYVKWRQGSA